MKVKGVTMGRTRWLLAVTSLVLAISPAGVAWGAPTSLEVFIRLDCSSVSGRIEPDLPLTVAVADQNGALKGFASVTSSGGSFAVDFSEGYWPFLQIVPGDTVTVAADGTQYRHTVSRILVASLDPTTGAVAGKVSPRRPTVDIYQNYSRLTASGWQDGWLSREGLVTSADGTFRTTFAKLRRLDSISIEYTTRVPARGAFTVYHEVSVPGLDVTLDASIARLYAERGRTFEGRLAGSLGALKGVARTTTTNTFDDDEGVLDFRTAAGDPIPIAVGDRLAVTGRWSFGATVPNLRLAVRVASDRLSGKTRPGGVVQLDLWLLGDDGGLLNHEEAFVVADDQGAFVWDAAGDIRPGDVASAVVVEGVGNIFRRYATAPPLD